MYRDGPEMRGFCELCLGCGHVWGELLHLLCCGLLCGFRTYLSVSWTQQSDFEFLLFAWFAFEDCQVSRISLAGGPATARSGRLGFG